MSFMAGLRRVFRDDDWPGGFSHASYKSHGIASDRHSGGLAISEAIPAPVLFNPHKHHAGFLRDRVRRAAAGPAALRALADELAAVGTRLMDLYHGELSPREIAATVTAGLAGAGHGIAPAFRAWVESAGGFRVIEFPQDASRWVLRVGDGQRFVHIHPARYSPHTVRVRAAVLTTAVMALSHTGLHGGDPASRTVVNAVRREYLGLPPVARDPSATGGLGAVIELLR
jgi:hypothetical protein